MVRKKKIPDPSTKEKKVSRQAAESMAFGNDDSDEALDWIDFKQVPTTIKTIMSVGRDLVEWATNSKDATKLHKFFRGRGIDRDTVLRWRKRCPEFDRLCRFALDTIGDRREDAAYDKQKDSSIVLKTMALYDPDFRSLIEWQSSLSHKDDDKSRDINVVLQAYPSSPLVPEKGS